MRRRWKLLAGLLTVFTPPGTLWAQQGAAPAQEVRAARSDNDKSDIARELAALREAIARLEEKIESLSGEPSEFSQVAVRVVGEQNEPLEGFEVRLTSSNQTRHLQASGVSDEDGLAVTRSLPYGAYRMSIDGHGWRARDTVMVEIGRPLELTIVAPTPDRFAELVLEPSLARETLQGLRFGGWTTKFDNGTGTRSAPEPPGARNKADEVVEVDAAQEARRPPSGWETFPTISEGIETVAVVVELEVNRRTTQPAGGFMQWEWQPASAGDDALHARWFVQSDGTVSPLLSDEKREAEIEGGAGWFGALAKKERTSSSETKWLSYACLSLGDQSDLRVPAGEITLSIKDIYGWPSEDVLQAIDAPAECRDRVWLRAVVSQHSDWYTRLLGGWEPVAGRFRIGVERELEVDSGSRRTLVIGAARPGE